MTGYRKHVRRQKRRRPKRGETHQRRRSAGTESMGIPPTGGEMSDAAFERCLRRLEGASRPIFEQVMTGIHVDDAMSLVVAHCGWAIANTISACGQADGDVESALLEVAMERLEGHVKALLADDRGGEAVH